MAQCPTGYVGRLFWPCSHFSGFMGNGQNLWHPVHFCLEGRGHSAISYRTTGFPRLFFLFFQASLGRPPSLGGVSFFSLSPLRVSCNTNVDSRRFHETYLQIIFIQISVFSLERISSSFFFCLFRLFDVSSTFQIFDAYVCMGNLERKDSRRNLERSVSKIPPSFDSEG